MISQNGHDEWPIIGHLLHEYNEKFGDCFPIYDAPWGTAEELEKMLRECIESGKPYEIEYSPYKKS